MSENNTVLVVAVLAVIASLAAAGFSYYSLSSGPRVAGFATSVGTANLTVESSLEINFTIFKIEWGSGKVETGKSYATLDTEGVVFQGNWSAVSQGLLLANIGNVNVSLDLNAGSSAATFLGGTGPAYEWKVTDHDVGSCVNDTQLGVYLDTTTGPTTFCTQFGYDTAANELDIDINITIPYDSNTGLLQDSITATATAAP